MENFKYFMLGLLFGYLTILAFCIPLSIVASSVNIEGFDKVILWAMLMGPVFGVVYTSSKGYFGRLALIVFVGCISLALLMSIISATSVMGEESVYSFFMVFSNGALASTGVLFLYFYFCIGAGECSFWQIYLIPFGIMLLSLGIFALVCLAGGSIGFIVSLLIALGCTIAVIALRKINGSALD